MKRKNTQSRRTATKKHTDINSHNVRVKIGAAGDYAKYELQVIKRLAKLLKKPYKKVIEAVNLDSSLLDMINAGFDKKQSVNETAQQIKAALIKKTQTAKSPLQAFVEVLNKLPKKQQPKSGAASFPMKLPATVTIGNVISEKNNRLLYAEQMKKIFTEIKGATHWAKVLGKSFKNPQQFVESTYAAKWKLKEAIDLINELNTKHNFNK